MKKLVLLNLKGDCVGGFDASLEIGEDGERPYFELSDKDLRLPPIPSLPDTLQDWRNSYRSLDGSRIKPKKQQITNVKLKSLNQQCHDKAKVIKHNFTGWLQADSFRRIKEKCLIHLNVDDEVRFIIRTDEVILRQLPWHLWDLFDDYPHIEVAFSSIHSQRFQQQYRSQLRILIILGNSEGINVVDDEKLLKEYCRKAELVVLSEPSFWELNEHLWDEKGWDIIFFSGHSRTEAQQGRIFINGTDSLTIEDLREGLKTAVRRGLQLAFFNSCDGLGIASELEKLHIPQVIVMREPVPDKIANQFLKYFFQEFTEGKSLYQSVSIARKKLQVWEKDYPCASWLPIIVQNLLEIPPTWTSLGAIANCPYRGLAAFREEDAPYFYGRETVTSKLVKAVEQNSFVAILGASGSGKSSLVFAGLIPQLKQNHQKDLRIISFRPGSNPFESLAIAIFPILPESALVGDKQDDDCQQRLTELELEIELKSSNTALAKLIEPIVFQSSQSQLVIVADQFEELYTLCQNTDTDKQQRQLFLDNLLNAVNHLPGFTLVVTLRADFYADAISYRPFADALQNAQFNLGTMDAQELQAAIEKPAVGFNIRLQQGLTQRLIDTVLDSANDLPLLEFTLTQLWSKQQQGWLTHQAYEEIGGVEAALANHAETVYQQLSPTEQQRVEQIFIQLVKPGERNAYIRRIATRKQVKSENWDLVAKLASARLVVTNSNRVTGVETVEIIHEALIKNWRRLQKWMRENQEFCYWQEQLRAVMGQWENSGKDNGGLLRGKPLFDAEVWLQQSSHLIGKDERDFINSSLELRDKERKAKNNARKRTIIGLTLGLILSIFLAGIAFFQRQQAEYQRKKAESNELDSLSQSAKVSLNSGKQIQALTTTLLTTITKLKQVDLDRDNRTKILGSVLEDLQQIRQYNQLSGHEDTVTSVNYSSNGELIASASQDKTIKIWHSNGKLLQTLTAHQDGVFKVFFSDDNQFMIAASFDNTVTLWRYNSESSRFEKRPFLRIKEPDGLWSVGLSNNKQIIATGNKNGFVKIWNIKGQLIKTIPAHNQKIWSLDFSSDNKYFTTASADKTIKIWDLSGKLLKTLSGHADEVLTVKISPDSKQIVSGSRDGKVKLWDVTGKPLHTFIDGSNAHSDEVLDVRWSADGKLIASASEDDTVKIWNVKQRQLINTFKGHGGKASEVSFNPILGEFGTTIATASKDKTIKFWRLNGILPTFTGNSVSHSPDGKIIAVAHQGKITFRDNDGNLLNSFKTNHQEIHKIIFNPDGRQIATLDNSGKISIWNLEGKLLKTWQGYDTVNNPNNQLSEPVQDISFSPDGKILATVGIVEKQVKLWNLSGTILKSWDIDDNWVTSIKFSPDAKNIAVSGDKKIKIWNIKGDLLHTLKSHQNNVADVSFSQDGKYIATAGNDKTVKLWNSRNGNFLKSLEHQDNVYSVRFNPNNRQLISASGNKIYFWNLEGDLLYKLSGNKDMLSEINFNSDGTILTSVDIEKVTLWKLNLNDLKQQTCQWLDDYFVTHSDDKKKDNVCD
jgi:WD40 repeat protein/energy-coupling factor transporter ATP-binding protein EcfA2